MAMSQSMIMQGTYTSDGNDKFLEVPLDANWIKLMNATQWPTTAVGNNQIVKTYWQQAPNAATQNYGMAERKTTGGALTLESTLLAAGSGISKINTGNNPLSAVNTTVTAITSAAPPVVSLTSTAGLVDGDIIRMRNVTGATQLQGMDFTIDNIVANTSLELINMVASSVATTAGFYKVKYEKVWYPRNRFISAITAGATTVIKMTVTHEYAVGDYVRIMCPPEFGMKEINLAEAKILAIDTALGTNTITVDIDSSGYTAFAFPTTGEGLNKYAEVIPLSGPITNTQFRGFEIKGGATAAGGAANDVIHWIAGDTFGI